MRSIVRTDTYRLHVVVPCLGAVVEMFVPVLVYRGALGFGGWVWGEGLFGYARRGRMIDNQLAMRWAYAIPDQPYYFSHAFNYSLNCELSDYLPKTALLKHHGNIISEKTWST